MYACRTAKPEDFPIVAALPQSEEEAFFMFPAGTYPLDAEQLREAARTRRCPTVVVKGQDVVGYANLYGFEEGGQAFLGNVIVAADQRGTGAARHLIAAMIEAARIELNVPVLRLVCHHTNPRALLFYDKMGFAPYGIKRMTGRRGETIVGILMEMKLGHSPEPA